MASLRPAPIYQGKLEPEGPDGQFIKASSNRKGQPVDLAFGGPTRYCATQTVYQRPAGHGFDRGWPRKAVQSNGNFTKAPVYHSQWPFIKANGRFIKAGHF